MGNQDTTTIFQIYYLIWLASGFETDYYFAFLIFSILRKLVNETACNNCFQSLNLSDMDFCAVIAFREMGCDYSAIKTFIPCMNTKSISENGFKKLNRTVMFAYKNPAEKSLLLAPQHFKKVDIG